LSENKKTSAKPAEDEITKIPWYHLNLPPKGGLSGPNRPQRDIGRTRLCLLRGFGKAAQKGIQYPFSHCLAPTGSSLRDDYREPTWFRHRVYFIMGVL
jgi:hypothetical protein